MITCTYVATSVVHDGRRHPGKLEISNTGLLFIFGPDADPRVAGKAMKDIPWDKITRITEHADRQVIEVENQIYSTVPLVFELQTGALARQLPMAVLAFTKQQRTLPTDEDLLRIGSQLVSVIAGR